MEAYMWIIWLALFVIMLGLEGLGPELISIWFAIGALVSLIVSLIPGTIWWIEVIIFVVVSIATAVGLRPLLKRFLSSSEIIKTNVDSFVGKKGYVMKDISYLKPGTVKIHDITWTAVPLDTDETILENSIIEVVAVKGNKLVVKKVEEK
ncbi:MAG: NfeD family protein [Erysipelotrichia bacterium]|nr:NfeD family protein [Erysipelotrichia bacterium]